MVGSFCLFVGNFAVLFDNGSPAICGLFACTSKNDAALAVAIVMSAGKHAPRMTTARIDRRYFMLLPPMGIERVGYMANHASNCHAPEREHGITSWLLCCQCCNETNADSWRIERAQACAPTACGCSANRESEHKRVQFDRQLSRYPCSHDCATQSRSVLPAPSLREGAHHPVRAVVHLV